LIFQVLASQTLVDLSRLRQGFGGQVKREISAKVIREPPFISLLLLSIYQKYIFLSIKEKSPRHGHC